MSLKGKIHKCSCLFIYLITGLILASPQPRLPYRLPSPNAALDFGRNIVPQSPVKGTSKTNRPSVPNQGDE